jgi:hypothetical protein
LQGETALCVKVHACVDVWSLCFYFSFLFLLLLLLGVSNTKGVEIRVDISMCVCTKPKITFKLYLSVLGYFCKCRGKQVCSVFPSDEFIYPYISFWLCNARTSSFFLWNARATKRFRSSVHCQKEWNPRIHQLTDSIPSTNPSYINKSTRPFMDMKVFSFSFNHKVNPFTKNLAKSENKNSCNNTNTCSSSAGTSSRTCALKILHAYMHAKDGHKIQSNLASPFHLAPVKWQLSYQVGRHSQSWPVKARTESPALARALNLGRLPSHTCRAHPFRFQR